jgi:hypothetical protein
MQKDKIMKKLKLFILSSIMVLLTACGTDTRVDTPTRFNMWEYMTATVDYGVKYEYYENGQYISDYVEEHRLLRSDTYERVSNSGVTTLYLNGSNILMREPSQDVRVEQYVYLGDRDIFHAPTIRSCSVERFYRTYERRGRDFNNVLMVECESVSGVHQEYFYGYNEGLIAIYEDNGIDKKEWIKVDESRI